MKTYKIFFLLMLVGLFSCDDIIDKEPLNSVSEEVAFEEIGDFDAALIGVYQSMASGSYADMLNIGIPTVLSDNVEEFGVSLANENIYDLAFSPVESVWQSYSMWKDTYSAIARANIIIRNIDGFTEGSDLERDNIKGEALALRGLLHFDLLRLYAPDYSIDKNAMGVPYLLELTQDYVERNTLEECYTFLIKDLEDATLLLDDSNNSWRVSKSAIQAILSRAYLYQKDYAKCIVAADKVMAYGKNSLASRNDYMNVWTDDDAELDGEVILRIRYIADDGNNPTVGMAFHLPQYGGYTLHPTTDFFSLYDQATDIRFSAFFEADAVNGGYGVNKYPGRPELAPWYWPVKANDIKIIRMSEVILNKAEALLEDGGSDADILSLLDEIRSRRIDGFVSANETGSALRTALFNERRKELAFEGHRFHDLKRWNQAMVRNGVELLPANDYRFAFPLPYDEVNRNPNLKQNLGY